MCLLLGVAAVDGAADARSLFVEGDSMCPSVENVAAELKRLVHAETVVSAGSGEGATIGITDLGDSVRVVTAGMARTFPDPARNCSERARAVAVFAALVLEPPRSVPPVPSLSEPVPDDPTVAPSVVEPTTSHAISVLQQISKQATPPPTAAVVRMSDTPPRSSLHIELEAAVGLGVAPSIGMGSVGPGGEVRLNVVGEHFGLTMGLGALSEGSVGVGAGQAQLVRIPLDVDLRLSTRRGRVEVEAGAGLVFAVLDAQGQGFSADDGGLGLDIGARVGIGVRVWVHDRVALLLRLHATYSPWSPALQVLPSGIVTSSPGLWLGVDVGVATRVR